MHLVAQMSEKGHALLAHADLQIDEEAEVFVLFFGMLRHEGFERLALDEFTDDCPSAVHHGDRKDLGDVEPRLLDARLVERFVEDVSLGIALVERLDELSAVAVEFLTCAFINEFHSYNILLIRGYLSRNAFP